MREGGEPVMGSGDPKKVLVFGVGVIGAYLTHALDGAHGFDLIHRLLFLQMVPDNSLFPGFCR